MSTLPGSSLLPSISNSPRANSLLQIARPQIPRVHLGRHPGAVLVPHQQVECRWLLAEQPVVHDVGEHQVVGPQRIEGVRHLVGVEVALLGHLLLEAGDRGLVGEDAERSGLLKSVWVLRNVADLIDDRRSPRCGPADRGQRAAEAHREGVDLGAPAISATTRTASRGPCCR